MKKLNLLLYCHSTIKNLYKTIVKKQRRAIKIKLQFLRKKSTKHFVLFYFSNLWVGVR